MKSIRQKILVVVISIMTVSFIIIGGIACYLNYTSTMKSLEQTMSQTVVVAAQRLDAEIQGYKRLVRELAEQAAIARIPVEQYANIAEGNGFLKFTIADADGKTAEGEDLSGADYFQTCKSMNIPIISDPIYNEDHSSMYFAIAAPVEKDGKFGGVVCVHL